jgi:hypothetical protein
VVNHEASEADDLGPVFEALANEHRREIRDVILRVFEIEATAPDELVLAIVAWRGEDGAPGISRSSGGAVTQMPARLPFEHSPTIRPCSSRTSRR